MMIIKMTLAILLAFVVFIGTIYILARLFFERINLDEHMKPTGKIKTSNLNG